LHKIAKILLVVIITLGLTACGGGGSNGVEGSVADQTQVTEETVEQTSQELALEKIISYTENGGVDPSVQDYIDIGVSGVNSENIDQINVVVLELSQSEVDTAEELQGMVDDLNATPLDKTAPVITLNAESVLSIVQGSIYTERGATAIDDRDGTVAVSISGSVNTDTVGTYTIHYTATDSAGNSTSKTRTVHVTLPVDTVTPTITLNGESALTIIQDTVYVESGAVSMDNRDGNITSRIVTSGTVDTSTLGIYTITYSVEDSAGNSASVSRTVNVVLPPDTTAPVITLNGKDTVYLKQFESYVEANATAMDNQDGIVKVTISGTVDTETVGSYIVRYSAIDAAGNSTLKERTIHVLALPGYKVKKTGLIKSYSNSGDLVTDGSVMDDGYYQTGITPLYTRDNTSDIVLDKVTTLQWQDNEVVTLNADDAISYCNTLTLGGYDDWRLPAVKELQSLVDLSKAKNIADYATSTDYLYDTIFKSVSGGAYWSSESIVNYMYTYHWSVDFYADSGKTNGSDDSRMLDVRCVRGSTQTISSFSRNDALETVEDNATRLMWQDNSDTTGANTSDNWKNWEYAVNYCSNLSLGGFDDWRLPSINELLSLVDYSRRTPAISVIFENLSGTIYWSSTSAKNQPSDAWRVNFKSGTSYYANLKTFSHDVRCVRDY